MIKEQETKKQKQQIETKKRKKQRKTISASQQVTYRLFSFVHGRLHVRTVFF